MTELWSLFQNNDGNIIHKWTHYFPAYEEHFSRFKNRPAVLVEIGVFKGGSLELWKKYLGPRVQVVGIDIEGNRNTNKIKLRFEKEIRTIQCFSKALLTNLDLRTLSSMTEVMKWSTSPLLLNFSTHECPLLASISLKTCTRLIGPSMGGVSARQTHSSKNRNILLMSSTPITHEEHSLQRTSPDPHSQFTSLTAV